MKVQAFPKDMTYETRKIALIMLTADLFKVEMKNDPRVQEFQSLALLPKEPPCASNSK